jgi:hypothetical protein
MCSHVKVHMICSCVVQLADRYQCVSIGQPHAHCTAHTCCSACQAVSSTACSDHACRPDTKCSISCRSAAAATEGAPHRGCSACNPSSAHCTCPAANGHPGSEIDVPRNVHLSFDRNADLPIRQRQVKPNRALSELLYHSNGGRAIHISLRYSMHVWYIMHLWFREYTSTAQNVPEHLQQRGEDAAELAQHVLCEQHGSGAGDSALQPQPCQQRDVGCVRLLCGRGRRLPMCCSEILPDVMLELVATTSGRFRQTLLSSCRHH